MGVLAACVLRHRRMCAQSPRSTLCRHRPTGRRTGYRINNPWTRQALRALMARNGYILLWGTTLTSCTALHLSSNGRAQQLFALGKGPDAR